VVCEDKEGIEWVLCKLDEYLYTILWMLAMVVWAVITFFRLMAERVRRWLGRG